ncbi:16202_t:CDS:1, partial [Dentiscutata heterogama]
GIVAGLVVITPGAGYVDSYAAVAYGIIGGMVCNLASKVKLRLNYDDTMDVFAVHGVGGFIGNILTSIFADKDIVLLSGDEIPGGAINGNFIQILIQLSSFAGMFYSFVITLIILYIMKTIMRVDQNFDLRLTNNAELEGTDKTEHGESAYCFDDL